ncbi:hypothetical protein HRG_008177 [Hirsutella rhossiliensis]|uniref:EXPERA domain-containing protein n=1 Tax=Hirsutella rhossiliensis TaxID=111463 RepID=A0A9P8SGD8_9HYPO|nr:uncharacterized protein HRG_08177 [Hirsutella rhossiliensis]KAH0961024.1 hypothetical protein HRG_08177 [Hirsutella rhossiliensis]
MASPKPRRDWLYLAGIGMQLMGMLIMDLVPFYPASLWEPPSSPLHALVSLRASYVSRSGDPYMDAALDAHEPWFRLFLYVEGLVQLPLAAYLVYQLASSRRASGPAELAALVFGCVTAMNASVCCFELWHMGPDRLSPRYKTTQLYGTYLPFAVIPAVMAVDMYLRLLPRVRGDSYVEAKKKRS